ncbi:glycerophosphodiester phosphodiesterase [Streptomyces sp. NPDC051320]|uniref:glycerophosphodiester phosphodiesterase n=1 Tax=Streptomyces sp. NPDC051320 TaxID=3154644 RepID=UPI0034359DD6
MRTVTAVAHRGDPYRVRENTLPSIRSALERGADAVEVDVRLTADGEAVLLHDPTLERLWGHDRPLVMVSADELRRLTAEGVPSLRAVLTAVGDHRVMIDLPNASDADARKVVGIVHECGAADRVYYCAGADAMLAVRRTDPAAEIAMTWTSLAPPRPLLLEAVRPRWLNYRFGLVSPELCDRAHRDGLLVSAWTADTGRTMRRLIRRGVDSITTNRIDVLVDLLRPPRP